MKKTLLEASLALVALSAHAESDALFNNPANHSYFGIRASFDIPCPKSSLGDAVGVPAIDYKNGVGAELKGIYNIPLVSNLYIEPGIGLYYDTYKDDSLWGAGVDGLTGTKKLDASIRNFGLRVPVMVGYHFDFTPGVSLAVYTGPMLDVGFISDYTYTNLDGDKITESLYKTHSFERKESRVDCKWMFGIGMNLASHYYVGVGGGVGLINLTNSTPTLHENLVQVSLGYNF